MTSFATKWGKLDHLEIKLATIGGFLTLANDALERSKCANATVTYFLKKQKKKQKKKTLLIRGKTEFVSRMRDQIQSQDACAHTEANQRKIANHTTYDTEIFDEFRKELANFIRWWTPTKKRKIDPIEVASISTDLQDSIGTFTDNENGRILSFNEADGPVLPRMSSGNDCKILTVYA